MLKQPLISVNMVVYNGEDFLKESIQSIIDQTYINFEFIIVNDGSTDKTKHIIRLFKDSRIHYIENKTNLGEYPSRNIALNNSKGKYIAIFDSDDISFPNRLLEQVEFLEKNINYVMIGSLADIIDKNSICVGHAQSLSMSSEETKVFLLFRNCFTHSSLLYRKNILDKVRFNQEREIASDFETIIKVAKFGDIKNLNKTLINYRNHKKSGSFKYSALLKKNVQEIISSQIIELGIVPSENELLIHNQIAKHKIYKVDNNFKNKLIWLDKLYNANIRMRIFPESEFYNKIAGYWFNLINNPMQYSMKLLIPYFRSPILKSSSRKLNDHIKFTVKCFIQYKNKHLVEFVT